MALVDLRDRQDEPAVTSLFALDTGSAGSFEEARRRFADRTWTLVGWSDDAMLVGLAVGEYPEVRARVHEALGVREPAEAAA